MSGQVSKWELIVDSRDAIANVTKFRNSLQTSFSNLPGIKELQVQFDAAKAKLAQLGASVTNLEKLKTATTATATEATKLATAEKGVGTALTEADTKTKAVTKSTEDLTKKTTTFGQKAGNVFSKGGTLMAGLTGAAAGVMQLQRNFRDYADANIQVEKAARKVSLAQEAMNKAQATLNDLTKKGITSGADFTQAQLDVTQAVEKNRLALQDEGEAMENRDDQQKAMMLSTITTAASVVTSFTGMGSAFKGIKGSAGIAMSGINLLKGAFTDLKIAAGAQGFMGVLSLIGPALIKVGAIAAGTYGGLAASSAVLDANVKPTDDWRAALQKLISDGFDKIPGAAGAYKATIQWLHDNVPGLISDNEMIVLGLKDVAKTQTDTTKATKEAVPPSKELTKAKDDYYKALATLKTAQDWNNEGLIKSATAELKTARSTYQNEMAKAAYTETTKGGIVVEQEHVKALDMTALKQQQGAVVTQKAGDVYLTQGGIITKVTKNSQLYASTTQDATKKTVVYGNAMTATASQIKDYETALNSATQQIDFSRIAEEKHVTRLSDINQFMRANLAPIKAQNAALYDEAVAAGASGTQLAGLSAETAQNRDQMESNIEKLTNLIHMRGALTKEEEKGTEVILKETQSLQLNAAAWLSSATITKSSNANLKIFNDTIGKGLNDLKAKANALGQAAIAEKTADDVTRQSIPLLEKQIISMINLNKINDGSYESTLKLTNARIAGVESVQDLVTQSKLKAEQDKTELASLQELVAGYHLDLPNAINNSIESLRAIVKAQVETGDGALALKTIIHDQLQPAIESFQNIIDAGTGKEFKETFKELKESLKGIGINKEAITDIKSLFETLNEGGKSSEGISKAINVLNTGLATGSLSANTYQEVIGAVATKLGEIKSPGGEAAKVQAEINKQFAGLEGTDIVSKYNQLNVAFTHLSEAQKDGVIDAKDYAQFQKDIAESTKEGVKPTGDLATNSKTLGTNLATIQAPDLSPFTSGLTDAANAAKLTASGVSLLKFDFPAPNLAKFAKNINSALAAAKKITSSITSIKYDFPPPNMSKFAKNANSALTAAKKITSSIASIKYNFPPPNMKKFADNINSALKAAKNIVSQINSLKATIHVSYSVDKKPSGLTSSATGGVFPNTSIIRAAGGRVFTTNGPHHMLVGDNPGGHETVAAIPHNNPGPTLAKIMNEFGAKVTNLSTVTGGGGGNNGQLTVNLYTVNNDRETLRTFKAQMGRDTYKFGQ